MMGLVSGTTCVFRGGTAQFRTTFFDFDDNPVNPASAIINLIYPNLDGSEGNASITMTAPISPGYQWTALWDSRGAGVGTVSGSVHSVDGGIPHAVEDFQFALSANESNLVTF